MCEHLKFYKSRNGLSSYSSLHAYFVACTAKGSSKQKTLGTPCYVCGAFGYRARLHACLSCVFIGCFKKDMKNHASDKRHDVAMDLLQGSIYCFKCQDYVHDGDFSSEAKKQNQLSRHKKDVQWLPSKVDMELFKKHEIKKLNPSFAGLRGIYNLGLTCYINCILQVFAHTPMLRNYFLSDRHKCFYKESCQACQCFNLFQELYSGKEEPLLLESLVLDTWKKNEAFKGRQANDAQEFYYFYLENLHKSCRENDSLPCRCVVHQIFSGLYETFSSCSVCGPLSAKCFEFWSIPLDIDNKDVYQSPVEVTVRRVQKPQENSQTLDNNQLKEVASPLSAPSSEFQNMDLNIDSEDVDWSPVSDVQEPQENNPLNKVGSPSEFGNMALSIDSEDVDWSPASDVQEPQENNQLNKGGGPVELGNMALSIDGKDVYQSSIEVNVIDVQKSQENNLSPVNNTLTKVNFVKTVKLTDCIKRYIQEVQEKVHLKKDEKIEIVPKKCNRCPKGNEKTQNVLRILPNILSFQMIRCRMINKGKAKPGNTESDETVEKNRIHVVFPKSLDMSPYIPETARPEVRGENGLFNLNKQTSTKNLYMLYAIVCHRGGNGGHYFTYVRKGDVWYLCDDHKIEKVEFQVVSKCTEEAYLFFYIKETLEYENTQIHKNIQNHGIYTFNF